MIKITFPDGSVKEYPKGITPYRIAESISPRLAADILVATVNGSIHDLERPIVEDATIKLHKWEDQEAKSTFWHSSSHLMAEALEILYPGVKFGIGPSIENGFYYDVDLGERQIVEADLAKIEKKMIELAQQKERFTRIDVSKAEAMAKYSAKGDEYKCELIGDLEDGTITFYTNGVFTDLCRGPHLRDTSVIKAVKLTTIAGAYWRGDEKNKMLTRIYGITFPKKITPRRISHNARRGQKKRPPKTWKRTRTLCLFPESGPGSALVASPRRSFKRATGDVP
jgi:threonyl-tRNA synthetase